MAINNFNIFSKSFWQNRIVQWAIAITIFIFFVYIVETRYGWDQIVSSWQYFYNKTFILILALILTSYLLRGYRIYDYFEFKSFREYGRALRLFLIHNILNNLLPMRSGELSFPILMKQYFKIPIGYSVPALFWFRILDLYTLILIGFISLFWSRVSPIIGLIIIVLYLGMPGIFSYFKSGREQADIEKASRLKRIFNKIIKAFPNNLQKTYRILLWTLLNWTSKILAFGWILSVIAECDFSTAVLGGITGEMSSVLPFHGLAGAGTYEAGVLASMIPAGVPAERALNAAVNLHLITLSVSMLSALIALPFGLKKYD